MEHLLAVGNDKNYEYYLFSQLLQKSGIVLQGKMSSIFVEGERTVAFVPTNEAIKQNIGNIPGCDKLTVAADYTLGGSLSTTNKTLLANYLRNYFISSLTNTITSYPYPGSSFNGKLMALSGNNVEVTDDGTTISVKLEKGTKVDVSQKYFSLPFAFSDGCMQFIDGILISEK